MKFVLNFKTTIDDHLIFEKVRKHERESERERERERDREYEISL